MMTPGPSAHIWIAAGHTDMRRGMYGLSALVQTTLAQNPFSGHVFVFRGRRGDLLKILWFDGDGVCRFLREMEWKQGAATMGAMGGMALPWLSWSGVGLA